MIHAILCSTIGLMLSGLWICCLCLMQMHVHSTRIITTGNGRKRTIRT